MPTPDEADRWDLWPGEAVLELHRDGKTEIYPGSRTRLRGAAPDDWSSMS
jgi:hypothetical protein